MAAASAPARRGRRALAGARSAGMKTAFVLRATEYGPEQVNDLAPPEWVDIAAGDFLELADKLGC